VVRTEVAGIDLPRRDPELGSEFLVFERPDDVDLEVGDPVPALALRKGAAAPRRRRASCPYRFRDQVASPDLFPHLPEGLVETEALPEGGVLTAVRLDDPLDRPHPA